MKIKVLLVDDEELILLGWQYMLETEGYQVLTALNAEKAIEIIRKENPDILITDLIMPGMNGVELCKKAKEINPKIEVVLISGHPVGLKNFQIDFIKAGGRDEFLKKPLYKDEIINTIKKITMQTS